MSKRDTKPRDTACLKVARRRGFDLVLCGDSADPTSHRFTITAMDKYGDAGDITIMRDRVENVYYVGGIHVDSDKQGHKLGTALYEQAAKLICERGGTMNSDAHRSEFSENFWRKQQKKGRAVCAVPNTHRHPNYHSLPWSEYPDWQKEEYDMDGGIHPEGWDANAYDYGELPEEDASLYWLSAAAIRRNWLGRRDCPLAQAPSAPTH